MHRPLFGERNSHIYGNTLRVRGSGGIHADAGEAGLDRFAVTTPAQNVETPADGGGAEIEAETNGGRNVEAEAAGADVRFERDAAAWKNVAGMGEIQE